MKSRPRRAAAGDKDPAASMALLREVMDPPLDPGYASSADRRERAGQPRSTGGRTVLLVVTSVLLGFLLSVAAQTLRTPDPADAATRAELTERIETADALGDEHATQIETLRGEITNLQDRLATPVVDQAELDEAALAAGATAVVGEGVVLTLNDPPPSADRTDDERVLSRDLQTIVNGLWAHGAEAIAINDQRLTSTSTIRFAGQAIVVDLKALARPYEVVIIGDREELMDEMRSGSTGSYLTELRSDYGILVDLSPQDEVTLPAASRLSTRVAHVPEQTRASENDQ
ncbi:DUF881 domain-containing protein [Ornithinimicrobium faecis]|uniref:DUF881 domain-containing protein n=1 Tax=Ornithinimicrobium faecis TaxID=2934158 RepID=A0ABY4Z0Z6_9MICO|nr:DUF881 domain-containing protein [Ornithinimicrobium sp. HY1793]USQ82047.1 DUF881 domain-containing protein [Ornithinimicrobium sp. HY1793]